MMESRGDSRMVNIYKHYDEIYSGRIAFRNRKVLNESAKWNGACRHMILHVTPKPGYTFEDLGLYEPLRFAYFGD
jgi:hypothetical protein